MLNKINIHKIGLIVVILLTSSFVFIETMKWAIIVFVISVISISLIKEIIYKKILITLIIINTIYMIVGNVLFSPVDSNTYDIYIFSINQTGLDYGLIGALKRNAMIIVSYTWLSLIGSTVNIYHALSINRFYNYNKFLLILLRYIVNQKEILKIQMYTLNNRDKQKESLRKKIIQSISLLKMLFFRFFYDTGTLTYIGETHFIKSQSKINIDNNIILKNVSVVFENNHNLILENINLECNHKEFVIIDGFNKSGKTTLLQVIAGYIPFIKGKVSGEVNISGKKFSEDTDLDDIVPYVKYILNEPELNFIGLTVEQEILLHTPDKELAKKALETMDIIHLFKRDTTSLSSGEKTRLVLASILASNIKIILIDSMLPHLDGKGKTDFINAIDVLYKSKDIIIIVSDIFVNYYSKLASRYVILENGKIIKDIKNNNIRALLNSSDNVYPKLLEYKNKEKLIKLDNISLTIDDVDVVKNFSIDIRKSDFITITGNNGVGKTSAMLILAGLLKHTSGHKVQYQDKLNIGFIFQNTSLQIVGTTIEEELLINTYSKNWTNEANNLYTAQKLKQFDFTIENPILELHNVDLKMLSIVANEFEVDIMIFDEPTTVMDNKDLTIFWNIIDSYMKNGIGIIIITHDDRIIKNSNNIINIKR